VKKNDESGALELIKASQLQPQQAAPDFLLRKGDVPGHEFHGNQYSDYNSGSNEASKTANEASRKANFSGKAPDHVAAANANRNAYYAHDEATRYARKAGNKGGEAAHAKLAVAHYSAAVKHDAAADKSKIGTVKIAAEGKTLLSYKAPK
jgi:hypothetical protein